MERGVRSRRRGVYRPRLLPGCRPEWQLQPKYVPAARVVMVAEAAAQQRREPGREGEA